MQALGRRQITNALSGISGEGVAVLCNRFGPVCSPCLSSVVHRQWSMERGLRNEDWAMSQLLLIAQHSVISTQ